MPEFYKSLLFGHSYFYGSKRQPMKPLQPNEISRQLRKPEGENGITVGNDMNTSNKQLYLDLFALLEIQDNDHILEIGFGNGRHFPEFFKPHTNVTLYGLDYSDVMCAEAAKNNAEQITKQQIKLQCGDAKDTFYAENQFDSIVALNTIYFWEPLPDYLNAIYRILKPGGKLYIGYRPERALAGVDFVQEGFSLYNEAVLNGLLEKTGFEIERENKNCYAKKTITGKDITIVDIITVCIKKEA